MQSTDFNSEDAAQSEVEGHSEVPALAKCNCHSPVGSSPPLGILRNLQCKPSEVMTPLLSTLCRALCFQHIINR